MKKTFRFSQFLVAVAIVGTAQISATQEEMAPETFVTVPDKGSEEALPETLIQERVKSRRPSSEPSKALAPNTTPSQVPASTRRTPDATTQQNLKKILPSQPATPEKRKISATILIETASTLQPGASNSEGEGYSQSGLYRLDVGIPIPGDLTASLRGGYSQEYSYVKPDGSSGGFTDSRAMLTKSWGEIVKDLKLSSSISLGLPTSKDSQRVGLKSAAGIRSTMNYKLGILEIEITPILTQNFHDVEVANNGSQNIERTLTLVTEWNLILTEKLSTGVSFWPARSWNYKGNSRDKYVLGYSLGYDFSKAIGIAIGVSTDASVLKSNGIESNYTLYDPYQTTGFLDLVVRL